MDGKGPTLNTGDRLTGTAGRTDNSLTVTDLTAGAATNNIPAGVQLNNIQNVVLNTSGNTAGSGFSTAAYPDVKNLNVTTQGNATDVVIATNGAAGTVVTANHNGFAGGVTIIGGTDVTATSAGAGALIVGSSAVGTIPLSTQTATGAVVVNQNSTGAGSVNVFGGTTVNVAVTSSSNVGTIDIGNTGTNTGNTVSGIVANPSGAVTVANAGTGATTVFGGTNVTITNTALKGAGDIVVGDSAAVDAGNLPSGNVSITETARNTYDGLAGAGHNNVAANSIQVYGGKDVTITTNAGGQVEVGNDASKGTNPTGNVTVTSTGIDKNGNTYVGIAGGKDVTVTTAGGWVDIGQDYMGSANALDNPSGAVKVTNTVDTAFWTNNQIFVDGGTTVDITANGSRAFVGTQGGLPTGAVTVTQAATLTGKGYAGKTGGVIVDGGTDVTVNTTGGGVTIGQAGIGYATGAVVINDTFSGAKGANAEVFTVLGGTTVNITTTATSGAITVGAGAPVVDTDGVSLKNAAGYSTGDVTITNAQTTTSGVTTYGTGATEVYSHGAATVSITGGAVAAVTDANTVLATSGPGAGKAIGASSLTNVVLNGNTRGVAGTTVTSDALAKLTITADTTAAGNYTVTDATKAHDLTLTVGGDKAISVTDTNAATLTVTDNGKAFAGDAGTAQALFVANATKATFTNTASQTFSLAGDAALTSVVASNSGALDLGDVTSLSKLAAINATKSTGGVTATIDGTVTSFDHTGGSGNDTITLKANTLLHSDGLTYSNIIGGSGSNTIVADYVAGASDTALGNTAHIKNFGTLALGASAKDNGNTYDASGFSALTLGKVAGDVSFLNVAAGAPLAVTATPGANVAYHLASDTKADTVSIVLNTAGSKNAVDFLGTATALTVDAAKGAQSVETYSVTSHGISTVTNTLKLVDGGAAPTNKSGTATINIDGEASLTLTDGFKNSTVSVINASGSTAGTVDVTGVTHLADTGATITGGAGTLMAAGGAKSSATDVITTGAGGGTLTIGAGGGWLAGKGAYDSGSETINLGASAAKVDTLVVNDRAISTYNGAAGGVTGYTTGVMVSDQLTFATAPKTVVANVATATKVDATFDTVKAGQVLDSTGALSTKLANLTFTISNGVVTFGATGGHQLSDFTSGELVSAAEIILANQGANKVNEVLTFAYGGNSYVVSSDMNGTDHTKTTLAYDNGGKNGTANADAIVTLKGVTSVSGFGTTGAEGTVVGTNVTNPDSAMLNSGTTAAAVYDETGYAADTISAGEFGTSSTSVTNLAPSATLTLNGGGGADVQAVSVTQTGSTGNNSLTLNLANADTYETLTTHGDYNLVLNATGAAIIKSLADANNTLNTITVNGGAALHIRAISDTGLKTIDATGAGATFFLGDVTAIANDGLTINLAAGFNSDVTASGLGDTISQKAGAGVVNLVANGTGDHISLLSSDVKVGPGTNNSITALGANDVITVGTGDFTVKATGSGVTITTDVNTGDSVFTVGSNATVNFTKVNGDGTHDDTVVVANDFTGATSGGAYALTTLKGAATGDMISFAGDWITDQLLHGSIAASQVNVAAATTLAQALDIAANYTALTQQPGTAASMGNGQIAANTGVIDWFQFNGNTYIVEANNNSNVAATHTALGAHDIVVEIVGLTNLAGAFGAGIMTM